MAARWTVPSMVTSSASRSETVRWVVSDCRTWTPKGERNVLEPERTACSAETAPSRVSWDWPSPSRKRYVEVRAKAT